MLYWDMITFENDIRSAALLSWILINKINNLHNYYTGDTTRSTLTLKMGDKAFSHVPAGWETAEEVGDVVGLTAGHECRSWGPIGPAEVEIKSLDSHQPLLSYTPAYTNDSECYVCYINYDIISGVGTYCTSSSKWGLWHVPLGLGNFFILLIYLVI